MFPVDLLIKGQQNDRRINHDVDVLTAWCDLLGVKGRDGLNLTGLIELLRQAGQGKRIEFKLERQSRGGGLELQITEVKVLEPPK